jgi:hypothetical protein
MLKVPRALVPLLAIAMSFALAVPQAAGAISSVEGQAFSGSLGSFSEPCPLDHETNKNNCGQEKPTATIDWGDSSGASNATVTKQKVNGNACIGNLGSCTFAVSGAHTYTQAGSFTGTVSWTDPGTGGSGSFNFTASVSDAPISLSNVSISRSGNDATLTATLTDQNPDAYACDYTSSIDWGDGATSSATITPVTCETFGRRRRASAADAGPATFSVTGTHAYASVNDPAQDAALTVTDFAGSTATDSDITVPTPPQTTTHPATMIGQTTATLNADVDTEGGQLQDCHFEWGTGTSYGHQISCSSISAQNKVTAALSGLSPNTAYHFEVVVRTNIGTKSGGDQSFHTLTTVAAGAPTVTTDVAEQVGANRATLAGDVNPNGHTLSDCHFDWGTTTSYGHTAPCAGTLPSGSGEQPVAAALTSLSPDTTYHFRVVASNAGSAASDGADASFTTLPQCDVEAKFGYVDAKGCLAHQGGGYTSTPGSDVQLDGLTLSPDSSIGTITIDPSSKQIITSGEVNVNAGLITVYQGKFTWTEPSTGSSQSVKITSLAPPPGTQVAGISLDGDLSLSFNNKHGADLTGNAYLPFGSLLGSVTGINGSIALHTAVGTGLLSDQLTISKDNFSLLGIGVKNLKVTYSPSSDTWEGGAQVSLPTPNKLAISADLAFQHGKFHKFSGSASNLNFPIFGSVDLQQISVVFGTDPTTIGGGLGLSFGPQVDGKQLVGVSGNFLYQAATSQAAGFIDVNGSVTLASFKLASAYFDYYTSGLTKFGGQLSLGLPDSSAQNPQQQPVYVSAGLDGALDGSAFDIEVKTTVALNFIDLTVGADLLVSDKGFVACAELSAFGFTWSPGVGYTWSDGNLDLMAHGCSVGPYETLKLGQASDAAAGVRRVKILSGRSLLELRGTTAAPLVTLTGPGGQHVTVASTSAKPLMAHGFMVLQDPGDKITWIAIEHGGGSWKLTSESGSSPISTIRDAPLLADPSVHGNVTGTGRKRTLSWQLRPIPGQRVVFWEKGRDVGHVIGSTHAAHGTLRFTAANGHGRQRTIEAQVFSYGRPRADLTIARYKAPAAARPGRPGRLKVTAARGGAVKVSWSAAANAQQYVIEVDANGARLTQYAGAKVRSVTIHDVAPIKVAAVKVRAELDDGVAGPLALTRYAAHTRKPKPKHKPPKKHKHKK